MKKRTRVVAWVMLVLAGAMLAWTAHGLFPILCFGSYDSLWETMLGLACLVSWALLWVFLLRRQPWAWWGLTVIYSSPALFTLYWVACTPSYWLARGKTAIIPIALMTIINLLLRSTLLLPLVFLLTDRPGGWNAVHEER